MRDPILNADLRQSLLIMRPVKTILARISGLCIASSGALRLNSYKRAGVTLVELMIALSILTIGILGLMGSFSFIQQTLQSSKNRTLASNLAQEKIQILKQKSYYQVLVTTSMGYNTTDFTPEVLNYDNSFFPPETVTEAGVTYSRLTLVQVAREDSGTIVVLGAGVPDTGMKLITVTVIWVQGGKKHKLSVRNIMSNPDTVMSNAIFTGLIRDSVTSGAIVGGLVSMVENMGWRDTTDATGKYVINAAPGSYTMMVSALGYYSQVRDVSIAPNATVTQAPFDMIKIATGSIMGYPWIADHLVISQVVGSTINAGTGYDQEYIEVFNPTTFTWTMNGNVGIKFQRSRDFISHGVQIDYIIDSIEPNSYYLFANTDTIHAGGSSIDADAIWSATNQVSDFPFFASDKNIIPVAEDGMHEGSGAISLYSTISGAALDRFGWDKSSETTPFYETDGFDQMIGLQRHESFSRISSTSGYSTVYAPGYDSNSNNRDFAGLSTITAPPRNSETASILLIAATPAIGSYISCTDDLSYSTQAVSAGNPPYAYFYLPGIATGTWTTFISSGSSSLSSTIVITPGATRIFSSSSTFLIEDMTEGIISGRILDADGMAISPGIKVSPGAAGSPGFASTANGRYMLRVSPGMVDVTANPTSGGSQNYVSLSSYSIPVALGEVHSGVDFTLYQGGRISGFVTRDGTNALPGIAVSVFDSNGLSRDQQVSGLDGHFTSMNVSTGEYVVQAEVGAHELVAPESTIVTLLTPGLTHFSSTFTVTGAMGYVTGTVQAGGQPIKTGVLIVVTTTTLASGPPSLSTATLTGAPYYLVSSMENGTYTAEVRGSSTTAYKVYAYYPALSGTSVSIASGSVSNVSVLAGQTTSGVNFSW